MSVNESVNSSTEKETPRWENKLFDFILDLANEIDADAPVLDKLVLVRSDLITIFEETINRKSWEGQLLSAFEPIVNDLEAAGQVEGGRAYLKKLLPILCSELVLERVTPVIQMMIKDLWEKIRFTNEKRKIWEGKILWAFEPISMEMEAQGQEEARKYWEDELLRIMGTCANLVATSQDDPQEEEIQNQHLRDLIIKEIDLQRSTAAN
ncbi:uncharacterized protein BP5553_09262 [Venustampulla echinocandica]|uniref:Uncharacterized protein n=1 Tax=Venustampulla echinocandica TaxID=2656787 RepID=A0A370TC76_9HELO|nr:uncharacterized protein BP5553_09262 [Venustampulla echinocandica]RDL31860.1 hypothetical protein BP5553_09262 [Venustampulla echinocandica]